MNTQNITLSVPRDILQKIKVIAAQQNTSISAFLNTGQIYAGVQLLNPFSETQGEK